MTARFLLDTDWFIDHFNGIAAITRRLEQLRPSGLALSVISLVELYEGVHYSRDSAASRRILSRFVTGLTVVPVDDEICGIFGRDRGKLQQQGRTVGDFDLLIAATGLRHDLTICTNNRRHFEVVDGVQLIEIV